MKSAKRNEKTFKKAVDKILVELHDLLCLTHYKLDVCFAIHEYKELNGGRVAAEILIDESYLYSKITLFRTAFDSYMCEPEKLFDVLLHEMCHFLIDPLYFMAQPHLCDELHKEFCKVRERQVETIARLFSAGKGIENIRKYAK